MKKRSTSFADSNLNAYFRSTKRPGPLDVRPGDVVGFTRYHCLQLGLSPTDSMWSLRGTVIELRGAPSEDGKPVWAFIQFEGEDAPRCVARGNLAIPGPNLRWCE